MTILTQARLKELLIYCPDTGVFTWTSARGRSKPGEVAGTLLAKGYIQVKLDRRKFRAHRLAFLWMTGELPPDDMEVDHINGRRDDNRWLNLRIVPRATNQQNRRKAHANNSTGFLGVSPNRSRYAARIGVNDVYRHLGTFDTPEEAHAAYVAAKRAEHAGCTI